MCYISARWRISRFVRSIQSTLGEVIAFSLPAMEFDADIFDAVEFGDLQTVQSYWTEEINIDWQDGKGMSLLMYASYYGHSDIVRFLLAKAPNQALENAQGKTAIEIAAENHKKEIVNILTQS